MANLCAGRNGEIIQAPIYECALFTYCGDICESGGGPLPPAAESCLVAQYDGTDWVATRPSGITEITVGPTTGFYPDLASALGCNCPCKFIRVVDTYTDTSTWSLPALGLTETMIYIDPGVTLSLGAGAASLDVTGASVTFRGSGNTSVLEKAGGGDVSQFLGVATQFNFMDMSINFTQTNPGSILGDGNAIVPTGNGQTYFHNVTFTLASIDVGVTSQLGVIVPTLSVQNEFHQCKFVGTGQFSLIFDFSIFALADNVKLVMSDCIMTGEFSNTAGANAAIDTHEFDVTISGLSYAITTGTTTELILSGTVSDVGPQEGHAGTMDVTISGTQVSNLEVGTLQISGDEINMVNVTCEHLGAPGVRTITTINSNLTNFFVSGTDIYNFVISRTHLANFVFNADTGLTFITNPALFLQPSNTIKGLKTNASLTFGGTGIWIANQMSDIRNGGTAGMRDIVFDSGALNNTVSGMECFDVFFRNTAPGADPSNNKFVNCATGTVFWEGLAGGTSGNFFSNCVLGGIDDSTTAMNDVRVVNCRITPTPLVINGDRWHISNCSIGTTLTIESTSSNGFFSNIDVEVGALTVSGSGNQLENIRIRGGGTNMIDGADNKFSNITAGGDITITGSTANRNSLSGFTCADLTLTTGCFDNNISDGNISGDMIVFAATQTVFPFFGNKFSNLHVNGTLTQTGTSRSMYSNLTVETIPITISGGGQNVLTNVSTEPAGTAILLTGVATRTRIVNFATTLGDIVIDVTAGVHNSIENCFLRDVLIDIGTGGMNGSSIHDTVLRSLTMHNGGAAGSFSSIASNCTITGALMVTATNSVISGCTVTGASVISPTASGTTVSNCNLRGGLSWGAPDCVLTGTRVSGVAAVFLASATTGTISGNRFIAGFVPSITPNAPGLPVFTGNSGIGGLTPAAGCDPLPSITNQV